LQRFALMLTILALVGIAAAVGTTRADAEEVTTTSTTPTTTTGCDVGEELYKGVCGVPDMGFNRFHTWRTFHRYWAHKATEKKCRPHSKYHFKVSSANIKPWRRFENLNTWKNKHNRAKEKSSQCLPSNPRDLGKYLAAKRYGWTGYQWEALDAIIMRESSWNPCRHYPSTTDCGYGPFPYGGGYACGIPQANPCSKLIGTSRELGNVSAYEQIIWTLDYIRGRYGSPAAALANGSTY